MIVYWNNFYGSLFYYWFNVSCLLLIEGWCYLRDLSSGASFFVWYCSVLIGFRVWVSFIELEIINYYKDRNREVVLIEISLLLEIGV